MQKFANTLIKKINKDQIFIVLMKRGKFQKVPVSFCAENGPLIDLHINQMPIKKSRKNKK